MEPRDNTQDRELAKRCLTGSKRAWDELYSKYLPLVQRVALKHYRVKGSDPQDIVQITFMNLYRDLQNYDSSHPLSKFVWLVAKQACVDEYRKATADKRRGRETPIDHHDSDLNLITLKSLGDGQDGQLDKKQQIEILKRAFSNLGAKCGELLAMRYISQMSFKDIAHKLKANKKSLAVQVSRCIDELRANFNIVEREGLRP
jgi:RNA polymerase sigma-70 factor (ECF subfamily)